MTFLNIALLDAGVNTFYVNITFVHAAFKASSALHGSVSTCTLCMTSACQTQEVQECGPPPSPICPAPLLLLLPFSPQRFFPKPFKPQRHQTCFIKKIKIKKKQASRTCRNESWVCEAGHSIPSLFSCLFLSFCRGICQTLSVNISLHYRKSILLSPSDLSELL